MARLGRLDLGFDALEFFSQRAGFGVALAAQFGASLADLFMTKLGTCVRRSRGIGARRRPWLIAALRRVNILRVLPAIIIVITVIVGQRAIFDMRDLGDDLVEKISVMGDHAKRPFKA